VIFYTGAEAIMLRKDIRFDPCESLKDFLMKWDPSPQ
jgi:hypothetical protein